MKIKTTLFCLSIIMTQTILGQFDSLSNKPRQQQGRRIIRESRAERALINFECGVGYSLVPMDDLNARITTIATNYKLHEALSLKSVYSMNAGIAMMVDPLNEIRILGAMSLNKQEGDVSQSYLQLYSLSLAYLFHFPLSDFSVYAGPEIGMIFLNSETKYNAWDGTLLVNTFLPEASATLGVDYTMPAGIVLGIEGRYRYATSINANPSRIDFTLKGFQGGIKLILPLIY
jgi:hypothetical protein